MQIEIVKVLIYLYGFFFIKKAISKWLIES